MLLVIHQNDEEYVLDLVVKTDDGEMYYRVIRPTSKKFIPVCAGMQVVYEEIGVLVFYPEKEKLTSLDVKFILGVHKGVSLYSVNTDLTDLQRITDEQLLREMQQLFE